MDLAGARMGQLYVNTVSYRHTPTPNEAGNSRATSDTGSSRDGASVRKYQCTKCDWSGDRVGDLNRHNSTHLPPCWRCQTCAKMFSRKSSLRYYLTKRRGNGECLRKVSPQRWYILAERMAGKQPASLDVVLHHEAEQSSPYNAEQAEPVSDCADCITLRAEIAKLRQENDSLKQQLLQQHLHSRRYSGDPVTTLSGLTRRSPDMQYPGNDSSPRPQTLDPRLLTSGLGSSTSENLAQSRWASSSSQQFDLASYECQSFSPSETTPDPLFSIEEDLNPPEAPEASCSGTCTRQSEFVTENFQIPNLKHCTTHAPINNCPEDPGNFLKRIWDRTTSVATANEPNHGTATTQTFGYG